MIKTNNCLFLFIDIQERLLNATFNKETLERKSKTLAKVAEILEIPILITEQYPKGLGNTIEGLNLQATILEKTAFNALREKDINQYIDNANLNKIIVAGIETHICVYQTVMALLAKGFDVTVVKDSCGSRLESEYNSAFEIMREAGAKVKTTEMVIFELLEDAKHPNFKEIQALIK